MPAITTDLGVLHFEVYGKGKPVLLLHGWLGSWGLWQETMAYLGQYFRTYALDFWGSGEVRRERAACQLTDFAAMVDQYMERMGISSAPLVGHSLGGTIALMTALRYPHRVEQAAVISSPIRGASMAFSLRMAGLKLPRFLAVGLFPLSRAVLRAAAPRLCRDPRFPGLIDRDLTRIGLDRFLACTASMRHIDLTPQLENISIPLLGIYGDRDNIVNPDQCQLLVQGAAGAQIERFSDAGHFPMLDVPRTYLQRLKLFLDTRTKHES